MVRRATKAGSSPRRLPGGGGTCTVGSPSRKRPHRWDLRISGGETPLKTCSAAKSLQSCPTLCNPRDGSPPGFPVPGILQGRTLERVAISFSENLLRWQQKGTQALVQSKEMVQSCWASPSRGEGLARLRVTVCGPCSPSLLPANSPWQPDAPGGEARASYYCSGSRGAWLHCRLSWD